MRKIFVAGIMGTLLASAAFAQTESAPQPEGIAPPPTLGAAVEGAGRAVGDTVVDGVRTVGNAASRAVNAAGEVVTGEVGKNKEQPGNDATAVMPEEFIMGTTIGKTSRMGEDLLIMQQEQRRLEQMKAIIGQVGIENAMALYPEIATQLSTSPMALQSQLDRVNLIIQLREAVARASGPTEYELERERQVAEAGEVVAQPGPSNGDLMSMTVNDSAPNAVELEPAAEALTREEVEMLIEEARLRDEQQKLIDEGPRTLADALRVTEVYGANGQMVALITDGVSTYKVRVGDEIPNWGVVVSISRDFVSLNAEGETREVRFQ